MLHVSARPPSLFMFYVETCRFSGCANKTTSEPGLSARIGMRGVVRTLVLLPQPLARR